MSQDSEKRTFYCPYCHEKLSFLNGTIIKMDGVLHAETFSARTQFYFPAKIGEYGVIIGGTVEIREGTKVEFHCFNPTCNKNFTTTYNHDLAEIRMIDGARREYVVIFNKVFGKKATFVMDLAEKTLVSSHGEHADHYDETFERPMNFFGAI